jgi:hypothetical protein
MVRGLGRRYRRNAEAGYSVKGTPVVVRTYGGHHEGTIESQLFGGVKAMFRIKLAEPVPLDEMLSSLGIRDETRITKQAYIAEAKRLRCLAHSRSMDMLVIVCMYARWQDVTLREPKAGMLTEAVIAGKDWPGRIVKVTKSEYGGHSDIALWMAEPATWFDVEKYMDATKVKPGFISKVSTMIPKGGYTAMKAIGINLPEATEAAYAGIPVMVFEQPVPIKEMAKYISQLQKAQFGHFPRSSVWYTLLKTVMFYVVPFKHVEVFKPMREDLAAYLDIPEDVIREAIEEAEREDEEEKGDLE